MILGFDGGGGGVVGKALSYVATQAFFYERITAVSFSRGPVRVGVP